VSEPWYAAEGLRFRCQSDCGNCCKGPQPGYAYLAEEEAERIAAYLGLSDDAFGKRYLRLVGGELCLTEKPLSNDCSLWDDAGGCSVYPVRPIQCRQFPFWPESVESEERWSEMGETCPGINRGTRYDAAAIARITAGRRGTRSGPKRRLPTAT